MATDPYIGLPPMVEKADHIICMACYCLIRQADVDRHYQAVHPEMVEADTGRDD